jgi:hypothetical protein
MVLKRIVGVILAAMCCLVTLCPATQVFADSTDVSGFIINAGRTGAERVEISLDGEWEMGRFGYSFYENYDGTPLYFTETAKVPGIVEGMGDCIAYKTTVELQEQSFSDNVFITTPRSFCDQKIFINGQLAGVVKAGLSDNELDVTGFISAGANELIILVKCGGAEEASATKGLHGSVKITVTGGMKIENVKIEGDPESGNVKINATVRNYSNAATFDEVELTVYELGTVVDGVSSMRKGVGYVSNIISAIPYGTTEIAEITVALRDFSKDKYWSCDNPYLYEFVLSTGDDTVTTRWGMRSFSADAVEGYPVFNGENFFLSGITMKFDEIDTAQEFLQVSDRQWTMNFFRSLKNRGMNIVKTEGSFPSFWYNAADELGILIVEEFPLSKTEIAKKDLNELTEEVLGAMQAVYNSPSAVVWDMSDNSLSAEELEKMVSVLRKFDGQGRPFDVGFCSAPLSDNDVIECDLSVVAGQMKINYDTVKYYLDGLSWDVNAIRNPKIITDFLYGSEDAKINASMLIEELRAKRVFSGILIPYEIAFATENVTGDSLAPVGIAIEFYEKQGGRGDDLDFEVTIINDTVKDVENLDVTLVLRNGKSVLYSETKPYDSIKKYGTLGRDIAVRTFGFEIPSYITDGTELTLEAHYTKEGVTVKSARKITINGGNTYESPYSTWYVVAAVAICFLLVGTTTIIAFGALKKHVRKKTGVQ